MFLDTLDKNARILEEFFSSFVSKETLDKQMLKIGFIKAYLNSYSIPDVVSSLRSMIDMDMVYSEKNLLNIIRRKTEVINDEV